MRTPGRILYDSMYDPDSGDCPQFSEAPSGIRDACDLWAKAVAESDRACVVARLEEFRASCDGYMTKAVWRELDAIMVEFGAEHKPYKFT